MSALIQLAKALSEKFTYEELKDYLNESGKTLEFTANGKKVHKEQLPGDQGVALSIHRADGYVAAIVTVPQGDMLGTCRVDVVEMLKDLGLDDYDYNDPRLNLGTVNKALFNKTHVKIPANGKLDLNKAFRGVNLKNFRVHWEEDGVRF